MFMFLGSLHNTKLGLLEIDKEKERENEMEKEKEYYTGSFPLDMPVGVKTVCIGT